MYHSLGALGWYIPGLPELPLGNRLSLVHAGFLYRFFVFSIYFSCHFRLCFFSFFFFRFVCMRACVRVLGARHRGRVRRCRGCQRVLACRGRITRSAVAVFVAGRCVCLATRGVHESALSGLHTYLWFSIEYLRAFKDRLGLQEHIQAMLTFATKLKIKERATQSEHQHCRAGERRPR